MDPRKTSVGLLAFTLLAGACAWAVAQPEPKAANGGEYAKGKQEDEEDDDEVEIKLMDAPAAVQTAAAKLTAAANIKKVIRESDEGITVFEIEYADNGVESAAVLSSTGEVMEMERAMSQDKLPAAVMAALKHDYPNATFADPQAVTKMYFEVDIVINGKTHEVKVDAAGNIEDEHHADGDDDDGDDDGEKGERNDKGEHREKGEKHEGGKH